MQIIIQRVREIVGNKPIKVTVKGDIDETNDWKQKSRIKRTTRKIR